VKNVSFLIVDDLQSVRSIVKSTVYNRLGSQKILSAVNGLAAKMILQKQPVDIIISDLEMPRMDGFELLSFVRSHPKLKNIPFIMMTSEDEKEFVVNAIQKGVSQYVVKPFTTEKLEEAIRRSWHSAEQRRNTRISHLPQHEVSLQFNDSNIRKGHITNISTSGILIELEYNKEMALFASCVVNFTVKFNENKTKKIMGLVCKVIRIEAQNFNDPSSHSCRIAVHVFEGDNTSETLSSLSLMIGALTENGMKDTIS
jgi:two-component system chemotaxis response regulator CheY